MAKPDSVERVLYIGDSVTHRGRIVGALKALYGDAHYEHWNAGVESFNTVQEVEYYRSYNRAIRPDHIVLTLHNNDFGITPVAFLNSDGQPVVYSLGGARFRVNKTLLQHSSIYQLILRYRLILSATLQKDDDSVLFEGQVREALAELRGLAHEDGARLTVLVLPILEAQEDWTASERRNHDTAIRLLEALGIRYFDLLEPLEDALERGIETNEKAGDSWHPGDEVAQVFAGHLLRRQLLEPSRWTP